MCSCFEPVFWVVADFVFLFVCRRGCFFGTHNTLVQHFLKLLLASADYKDFSRIMVREASFYYATGTSSFGRLPAEDEARLQAEANKEADESPSKK